MFPATEPLILHGAGYPAGESWRFISDARLIEIDGCNEVLRELLPLLDGTRNRAQICATLPHIPQADLEELLNLMSAHNVVANPHRLAEAALRYARDGRFPPKISEAEIEALTRDRSHVPAYPGREHKLSWASSTVTDLLRSRRSRRSFGTATPSAAQTLHLCWSVCGSATVGEDGAGEGKRPAFTVPSGGALYATLVYLYLSKACEDIGPGFYFWNSDQNVLQQVTEGRRPEFEANVAYPPQAFGEATGLLILVSCLNRVSTKYGNRAVNLALLEAGHMMQNAYLFCAQEGLGLVELAGFDAPSCASAFHLDENRVPLIVGLFGT